jgi:hypothetical protein
MWNVKAPHQSVVFGVIAGPSMSYSKWVVLFIRMIVHFLVMVGLAFPFRV